MRYGLSILGLCIGGLSLLVADEKGTEKAKRAIAVLQQAESVEPVKAQQAAADLLAVGPPALPLILAAIPEKSVVAANWLRSAHDRIVTVALAKQQSLPVGELTAFAQDRQRVGKARRLALETLDRLSPGTAARFVMQALDDPEFGPDAVELRMTQAAEAVKKEDKAAAIQLYREAFDAAQNLSQSLALAGRLKGLGVVVDPLPKLGVVRVWHVVGPFDDPDEKGYATPFAPEKSVDLQAQYPGKEGMIAWKPFTADTPDGRIDLSKAIGSVEGAVAYAFAKLNSPIERAVEIRAGGDDNLAVWLNGVKVIDHPNYRSHLRLDWHKAKVKLKSGENTLLVKVCQCPAPKEKVAGPANKWEFHLRILDTQGRGLTLP